MCRASASRRPRSRSHRPSSRSKGASVGYEAGKPVLAGLDLRLDNDDRIALLGANGNGKSTFAKLISGRLAPEGGRMQVAPNLKIGFFAQHQLDDLVPGDSAVAHVRKLMPDAPEAKVRGRVAQMGLATEKMDTAARDLSGGEKARLLMGLATFDAPNLLILDEPTNHLDIDSRQALVRALNEFEGAVILISHDRHLLEATVDRLWLVRDGTVRSYDGDLEDYRSLIVSGGKPAQKAGAAAEEEPKSKADQRKAAAGRRAAMAPLKKKISEIESLTARLEKSIQALDAELADPSLYERAPGKAAEIAKKRSDAQARLAEAEDEWLSLSAEYDDAMVG